MCFDVDTKATRPRATRAYKVVHRAVYDHGKYHSEFRGGYSLKGTVWTLGRSNEASQGRGIKDYGFKKVSNHGIYVFTTLKAARADASAHQVILLMKVKPADWICSAREGSRRTYKRATPLREVK